MFEFAFEGKLCEIVHSNKIVLFTHSEQVGTELSPWSWWNVMMESWFVRLERLVLRAHITAIYYGFNLFADGHPVGTITGKSSCLLNTLV